MKPVKAKPAETPEGAGLSIVWVKVEDLKPYPQNSRTHDDTQIGLLMGLMREFGWTNPILTDGAGGIIAGEGRFTSATKLWAAGLTIPRCPSGWVPTIALDDLTPEQRRAYVIADNESAARAGWDFKVLRNELLELDHHNFDLKLTGFAQKEIERIMTWTPGSASPIEEAPDHGEADGPGTGPYPLTVTFEQNGERDEFMHEMKQRGIKYREPK